ncbi:hypothetical protein Aperf_G00000003014 [Anoplocephala perfoliata]
MLFIVIFLVERDNVSKGVMLSNDLKVFLQNQTDCQFSEREDPYYQDFNPWNPNISQQIRHLTKASRRAQRLRFLPGRYLGDPEAIMTPFEILPPPRSAMYIPPPPKKTPPEVIKARFRQSAQEAVILAVSKPLSQAMAVDSLPPLYNDAGRWDRYAGIPRHVSTRFFHEDELRVRQVAREFVKSVVRKATFRVRREQAVVCPWMGSTIPTFGPERVYHFEQR